LQKNSGAGPELLQPPEQGEREALLSLLEKDLPEQIFCQSCSMIHGPNPVSKISDKSMMWKLVHGPNPVAKASDISMKRMCYRTYRAYAMWDMRLGAYEFSTVQSMMKRYRAGLDCKKTA